MKIAIIGRKVGMTQIYDEANTLVPVTVIEAGPCPITQVKTKTSDGYGAVQIGFRANKASRVPQPVVGHLKKAGVDPHAELREFRTDVPEQFKVGEQLTVGRFQTGQKVDVIAETKGRGFQGVMKRFGFAGGPASHGSMFHRRGGSYGCRQSPGGVNKGKRMPGHMGTDSRTQQNLTVVKVVEERNLLLLKGSLPGGNGSIVLVRTAIKGKSN